MKQKINLTNIRKVDLPMRSKVVANFALSQVLCRSSTKCISKHISQYIYYVIHACPLGNFSIKLLILFGNKRIAQNFIKFTSNSIIPCLEYKNLWLLFFSSMFLCQKLLRNLQVDIVNSMEFDL